MADEAYRAVFLRVHPTGKMVLSLTTDSDGKEPEYAELVARELGVPALDVKVVPADTNRFGTGHGYNTSPSEGTPAAISSATAKIRDKGKLLAGMALEAEPGHARVDAGLVGGGRRERSHAGQDARGRGAVRARHRRAAAGRRGRPRRADGLPGLTLEHDPDVLVDLQRAEQRRVRLHSPVGLVNHRLGAERRRPRRSPGRRRSARFGRAGSGRPPRAARCLSPRTRVERNSMSWRLSTSSSMVWWMFSTSSSPSSCIPPVPSCTRSERGVGLQLHGGVGGIFRDVQRRLPRGHVHDEVVAGLRRGAGPAGVDGQGRVIRSEAIRA